MGSYTTIPLVKCVILSFAFCTPAILSCDGTGTHSRETLAQPSSNEPADSNPNIEISGEEAISIVQRAVVSSLLSSTNRSQYRSMPNPRGSGHIVWVRQTRWLNSGIKLYFVWLVVDRDHAFVGNGTTKSHCPSLPYYTLDTASSEIQKRAGFDPRSTPQAFLQTAFPKNWPPVMEERPTSSLNPTSSLKWYEGGTLHQSSISAWKRASYRNKLATCADFISNVSGTSISMAALRIRSSELVTCMNEATAIDDPAILIQVEQMKVSEVAAACMILMGYDK